MGTHSVKTVSMVRAGGKLRVDQVGYAVVDRNLLNADPITAQANAVVQAIQGMALQQSLIVGSLPDQAVVIRHPRLPNMPYDEIAKSIEAEAGQNIPYDLSEVFLDWALLQGPGEGEEGQIKVLLAAARHEVIETRVQVADAAEIKYAVLGVDSLALANPAEVCGFFRQDETVALVNLGASSTNIHFLRGGVSNFIRHVSWGTRELVQAIAKGQRCEYEEAERVLQRFATGEHAPQRQPEPAPPKKAPPAASAPSAGSPLEPLEEERGGLGEEPASKRATPPPAAAPTPSVDIPELLATPLARLVAEVRRSFEYYEHQLYERPVDRILLSGGVVHIPLIVETLTEELGLEHVEVSNPAESALRLGSDPSVSLLTERPAQFMVAVGLAAAGAEEL